MANAASPGDIDALARQYWDTWGGLLGLGPVAGGGIAGAAEPAAFDWYARMQQLAAQFAEGGSVGDIAGAWRNMLGGHDGAAFAGVLGQMPGIGAAGNSWPEQVRPLVDALLRPLRQQASDWLGRPGLGPGREHQQRLQALAMAWQEWEERSEAFNALLGRIGQDAFARFERLLLQHESPEKRLATARALFDLWIDAAEEAWAEAALSEDYQQHYAAMTNALMRVRQGLQGEVERMGALLGLPGRTEIDAVHRKVAELERTVHALRRAAAPAQETAHAPARRSPRTPAAPARRRGAPDAPARRTARAAGKAEVPKGAAKSRATTATAGSQAQPRVAGSGKQAAAASAGKSTSATGARTRAAAGTAAGKPAAAKRAAKTPAKAPARNGTARATTAKPASKSAAKTTTGKAPAKAASAGKAARPAGDKAAKAGAGQVVSMKEWVDRNAAGSRSGGRGSRRR